MPGLGGNRFSSWVPLGSATCKLSFERTASCWVHVNDRPCLKDEPEGAKADDYLRNLLGLSDNYGILCAVALGYSDFEPKPLPPYEGEERVMWK